MTYAHLLARTFGGVTAATAVYSSADSHDCPDICTLRLAVPAFLIADVCGWLQDVQLTWPTRPSLDDSDTMISHCMRRA